MIKYLTLLTMAVMVAGQVRAAVIPGVTIKSVSSQFTSGATDQRRATNLISEAGLFGHYHTTDARGAMWLTASATVSNLTNASVTFDLGAVRTVNKMKVWNYNEAGAITRRGVKTANISVAGENETFTTNLAAQVFTRASGTFSNVHDTIDMGGISARYVRIDVLTNYYENDFFVGLSEVQFIDNTVLPTVKSAMRNFVGDRVTVRFSEPVLPSSATNLANYSIQGGPITILGATLNTFEDSVVLQTSALNSNLVYTVSVQNVRDAANVVTIANTQLNIDRELVLWLKADGNLAQDGSGFVSQWDDNSGLGNHAVQLGGGVQPVFASGAVNGKPAIHFDGVSQVLEVPHNANLVVDRDLTIYMVLSIDALAGIKGPISKANNNIPSSFDYQIAAATGKPTVVRGNGSGFTAFGNATAGFANLNEFYIAAFVMKGTNASHYLNGNFNGGGFVGAPLGDSGTPIRIGLRADAVTKFAGNLAEVMVLRGAASEADQSVINTYLGNKYGISVVAIAITSHPEDATRSVGQQATFGVTATAGSPTILYQWKKGTTNIPGATNALYTTPTLTLLDNATTYSVVVSTPLGVTTTSTTATLTVLADTKAPTVYSATRTANPNDIVVNYSELLDPTSATNIGNYSINKGATILSATLGGFSNVVVLTTAGLAADIGYALTIQNVQDLLSNGMAPTTTPVLPAGAVFWIRADSGVVTNASGSVSQSDDQTIHQNHALQYKEIGRRPALIGDAMNGKPVLRFDGASNFLEAASSPSLAIAGDMTIYAVVNVSDYAAGREILSKTAVNQPASFDFYVQHSPLQSRLYRGNGAASAVIAGTAPSVGVSHVLAAMQQGTAVSHYLDGAASGTGVLTNALADTGAPLRVGSRNDLFQFMKGDIAEILLFNKALSAAERKMIDNYLGVKYFPFSITQQPTNITKLEGEVATFNVGASAGAASFEYQWQKNTVNIPGATNTSYTTPTLTQGDSNSSYRAVIIRPDGTTVNSDSALLTVLADQELPTVVHSGKKLWNTNQIVVIFSEPVDPATATNISNYSIDNGATITSVVIGNAPNEVVLTVTGLNSGSFTLTVQNVRDNFNNVMSQTFVPVGLFPANLALWLNAETNVTVAGDFVSSWGDLSGNANNATEIIGGTAPLFVANAINGRPALRFDGTNQFLAVASSPSVAITGDMTLFVVANFKDFVSTANEIGMVGKSQANQPAPYDFYLLKTSGLPRFYRGDGAGGGSVTGTMAPSAGTAHSLSVRMSGTSVAMFLDGESNGAGTINVPIADTGALLGIGTRDDLRPKMNGDIAEILMFGSALTESARAEIENYLAIKYGIIGSPVSLSIQSSGNSFVISWPVTPVPLVLESKSNLSTGIWGSVTNAVEVTGGVNRVTITPNGSQGYYRLKD